LPQSLIAKTNSRRQLDRRLLVLFCLWYPAAMDADAWRALINGGGELEPEPDWGQQQLASKRAEVLAVARQRDLRLVRFHFCDLAGIIRAKAVHLSALESRLASGVGLPTAIVGLNALDQPRADHGLGPVGELRLVPDLSTFVSLAFSPRCGAMLSDLLQVDGRPWPLCPRTYLKRMIARALERGLAIRAAFEPEWVLTTRQGDQHVPFDGSLAYSGLGMTNAATVIDELVSAFEYQGLPIEHYHAEIGHGQQELTLRHAPALRAADNQVLYRETVRGVAFKQGLYASFAPKPWPSQPGNGCHVHFSAWDPSSEVNLFHDPGHPLRLSELGRHFLAGVLEHLPALVALTCPSFNSYRRLQPGSLSGAFLCYGPDNREAALRIASSFRGAEAPSANIELKACDNTTNPYLALGGLIAAGLDGVDRRLLPDQGRLAHDDPGLLDENEREARGIHRLPAHLNEAIDQLERDEFLRESLGEPLANAFLTIRRSEWDAFKDAGDSYEHAHHVFKY
jgi:glutamine synthetase